MTTASRLAEAAIAGDRQRVFGARGAAARLLFDDVGRAPEVVLSGPAGTGKSRACLEYVHKLLLQYPGVRALMLRKTLVSLVGTGVVTYREKVLDRADHVVFFGGSRQEPASFRYPNGSRLVLGGIDRASKIMSSEYDLIYVQEATELVVSDWEALTTRLRNGVLPWQQMIGDCNPDAPTHWLKRRADSGQLVLLESRHADNPAVTADYLAKLDALTGVRYQRLRLGRWAAAEGMIYEGWDAAVHLIDRLPLPADVDPASLDRAGVPRDWPRCWSVDFGFTNPFVCQWWCEDPDGRLYRYRELYHTQRLVEDHARAMLLASGVRLDHDGRQEWSQAEPEPVAVICDHDAEDRATLERHLRLPTTVAVKAVSPGIQAVAARLRPAGDGRPRLFLLRRALMERDADLDAARKPCATEEEIEGYVWDTTGGRRKGEEPVKRDDHGLDALRYAVAQHDLGAATPTIW